MRLSDTQTAIKQSEIHPNYVSADKIPFNGKKRGKLLNTRLHKKIKENHFNIGNKKSNWPKEFNTTTTY